LQKPTNPLLHPPLQSPGLPPPPASQPPGIATAAASAGGYSQYTAGYSGPPQQQQQQQQQQVSGRNGPYSQDHMSAYQQHQTLYRPTEAETAFGQSAHGYGVQPSSSSSSNIVTGGESGSAGGKRGSGAGATGGGGNLEGRMEKRVGGFLKRLDRLI
ncbi:hypothetical protein KC353_g4783, partial [Hortaea werneckii]